MSKARERQMIARMVAAHIASGGTVTVCPDRFAAPSQAGARRNPYRR